MKAGPEASFRTVKRMW